ncbi:hypothetical protein A7K93_01465 [Candidatus Methylacidiphilum fumarolicum]|nr:hypothetical protein A7K73_10375 [Candidatus Methylacidiphilum fumarolicum]TFE73351.1 hypothetical protein A7K72_06720 [Candidatus Methylacidiphilum fumarolicum]TFE75450.1 hypothetical protein A7K93_01465 [Candidatus Methylacidiphilum fumarolicum]TFE76673.1 hypothetical protein A7D33_09010 [Candidatus Methylacidiphilum fumarolicum]
MDQLYCPLPFQPLLYESKSSSRKERPTGDLAERKAKGKARGNRKVNSKAFGLEKEPKQSKETNPKARAERNV